jgi:predicted GNAT family acetyltransferase
MKFESHFHADLREHVARCEAFLLQDRVFNMHQLRIGLRAVAQLNANATEPEALWGVSVTQGETVVACAIYTSREALFVSPHAPEATPALIAAVPRDAHVADVVGYASAAWQVAHGLGEFELFVEGSLYALETAPQVFGPRAPCVLADASHVELLTRWIIDFITELKLKDPIAEVAKRAADRVAQGQYFLALYEDTPVAMAGGTYVGNGIGSIGPVYTLPNFRGTGLKLGQVITAHTARQLRAQGALSVVLMADQKNPVSNAAYQKIGFVCKGDFHHLQRVGQPGR